MALLDSADDLLDAARAARANAHAPYSRFPVGAALLAEDGRVFTGCNIENASYPLTICAERVALFKAVSEGVRSFRAIAVIGPQDDIPCSPCGACRQVLHEFGPTMRVITPSQTGKTRMWTVEELLPHAFRAEHLV